MALEKEMAIKTKSFVTDAGKRDISSETAQTKLITITEIIITMAMKTEIRTENGRKRHPKKGNRTGKQLTESSTHGASVVVVGQKETSSTRRISIERELQTRQMKRTGKAVYA